MSLCVLSGSGSGSGFGFANAYLLGCSCSWTFPLNIGLNVLPSDSFMSCLDYILGYSTGDFQIFQLTVLVVCGVMPPLGWSTLI